MLQQTTSQPAHSYTRLERVALVVTLVVLAITVATVVVAPFLAWQWVRLPFPGFTLEPSSCVSGSFNPDWEGLQKGLANLDCLTAIEGQAVRGTTSLNDALRSFSSGQTVTFSFVKADSGQPVDFTLTLARFSNRDFLWFFIVPYLVGLSYLVIGVWVFRMRYWQPVGRVFALLCCGVALTTGLYFDVYTTHWLSWAWIAGIPLGSGAMIVLSLLFPQEQRIAARWKWLRWAPFLPAVVLMVWALMTTYDHTQRMAYVLPWRYGYFYIGVGLICLIGMILYRRYFSPSPVVQRQSRIILWGTVIAFLPAGIFVFRTVASIETNFVPWMYLGPLIVFPLAIAYAIVRYRILDLDLVISHGISYAILTGVIVGVYFLMINAASALLSSTVEIDDPWLVAIFVLLVAVLLDPVRKRLQSAVDAIFYRDGVDYRHSLESFSYRLTELVDLEQVVGALQKEIARSIHPAAMSVYLYDQRALGFVAQALPNLSYPAPGASRFPAESALAKALADSRAPVYIQLDRPLASNLTEEQARLRLLGTSLFVPLRGGQLETGRSLEGWLALDNKQSGQPYTNDDLDFLVALTDQTMLALGKARIFADLNRRVEELSVLSLISQAATFALEIDDIFELIYTQTGKIIDASNFFYIALYDDKRETMRFAFYVEKGERLYPEDEWELGTGLTSDIVRTRRPIVTDDYLIECEKRGVIPSTVTGSQPARAWMGVPLMAGDRVFGVINVCSTNPDVAYSEEHLKFFRAVADQTANILEKTRLYREMEQRALQLATLNEVGRTISSTLDLRTALGLIIEKAAEILHGEAASLFLVDQETDELVFEVAMGPTAPNLLGTRMPKGKGIVGTVAQTLEPTIVNDVAADTRWYKGYDKDGQFITRALIAVPLVSKDRAIGVVEVLNKLDGSPFDANDLNLLQTFAAQSAVAIENARMYTLTDAALALRVEELQTLQRIDRELNASLDVERALDLTVEWAMRITNATAGLIGVVISEDGGLLFHALHGYGSALDHFRVEPWPLDKGIIGRVAQLGFPNLVPDVSQDLDYVGAITETKSVLAAPVARENRVIGVIALESDTVSGFDLEDLNFVVRLADHAAIAISNSQLYEQVKRANEYKSEFVSVVAHELKLPMQNIKGYGDLLSKGIGGELTEMQQQFLGVIRSNVDRMNTLVSDLLDISRIETGRMRLDVKPMPIQGVVEDVVRSLTRAIEEKQQTIQVQMPDQLPQVMGDKSRLIQILTNLISNAYKYTPDGGQLQVQVREEARNGQRYVVCAVKDNGVGISQEDVARLGQKFFRASDQRVRDVPGHGLGLSIVKNLIQMHGGELTIESEIGVGSTFSFNVPVAEDSEPAA